ncbi:MAG: Xaa-Pro peptidase family protein [Desulfurococcaceae archaeon]
MWTSRSEKERLFLKDFPPEEFKERRKKLIDAIGQEACALVPGMPFVRGFYRFRQSNDFYYLCGVEIPHAYLLIDGASGSSRLYIPRFIKGGKFTLTLEDSDLIREFSGIDEVLPLEDLFEHLKDVKTLYVPHRPSEGWAESRYTVTYANMLIALDPWDGRIPREQHLIGLLKARFPKMVIKDLTPILDSMRLIKSDREIKLLRKAGELAALAVTEAMRITRPGLMEYHLRAIASFIFIAHGGSGEGYLSIIATGNNIWDPHYYLHDTMLKEGDLVLMDAAPEYHYYTSDIGRMWPVSGKYLQWQRELYGFIVEYHKTLLQCIRPGLTPEEVLKIAAENMVDYINKNKFSKDIYRKAAERALQFTGHLSHTVGMAVHDAGDYHGMPFRPGMVFSVDPQMWVPEEELYIRVEDTVVVTENGVERLTGKAPLDLDDVEETMRDRSSYFNKDLLYNALIKSVEYNMF